MLSLIYKDLNRSHDLEHTSFGWIQSCIGRALLAMSNFHQIWSVS